MLSDKVFVKYMHLGKPASDTLFAKYRPSNNLYYSVFYRKKFSLRFRHFSQRFKKSGLHFPNPRILFVPQ